jgi:hypothetical protein
VDWSLFSRVVQCSSGIEQSACSVIVAGNAAGSASDLVVGHCVMKDVLDLPAFKDGLRSVGLDFACCPDAVIAGVMGDPMLPSKSGSEHQGPRGSTCVAIFARP